MESTMKGLVVLSLLIALASRAQDTDSIDPAVDTSAVTELAETTDRDEIEPGVSTSTLTAGVQRRETDAGVMDEMNLSRTEITGNQELPKVLYIVPWQKSDPGQLVGPPVNTLLDEVLAPVDRTEFRRRVDYYNDLNPKSDE